MYDTETSEALRLRELFLSLLLAGLEDDSRRRGIYEPNGELTLVGWCRPGILPLMLSVSGPAIDENANPVYYVAGFVPVGQLPDAQTARQYVRTHNLLASTTYAWIYGDTNVVSCATSSVIKPDSEEDIAVAITILQEMYSAALGKWTWFLGADRPDGWRIPDDTLPPSWTDADVQHIPDIAHLCAQLLEYSAEHGNNWESTILPTTAQALTSALLNPVFGTSFSEVQEQAGTSLVPFFEASAIPGAVEQHGISVAAALALVPDAHPYIGQGVRATLHMPHRVSKPDAVELCNALNTGEVLQMLSGSTMRGAWLVDPQSLEDSETVGIAFHSFYASAYCGLVDIEEMVADMFRRAQFVASYLGHTRLDGSRVTTFNSQTGPGSTQL